MSARSPFHEGEHAVQERLGVRSVEVGASKGVRAFLPEQHREFYENLPMLIASARDSAGQPWASMLCGTPGFASSPDETSLVVATIPDYADPLREGLVTGRDIAFLGIDFATLRRNRANGTLAEVSDWGVRCVVKQTYGNCQKYITRRKWTWVGLPPRATATSDTRLTPRQKDWILHADTFFIATGYRGDPDAPSSGMDASHRGGSPGFVEVSDHRHVVFPDYVGNNFFNTFGNLEKDARCGLLFVEFEQGSLLQLTGRAWVEFDKADGDQVPPAQRFCHFELEQAIERVAALPLRWSLLAKP